MESGWLPGMIPVAFDPILSPGSGRDQGTGDASGVALMSLINILG